MEIIGWKRPFQRFCARFTVNNKAVKQQFNRMVTWKGCSTGSLEQWNLECDWRWKQNDGKISRCRLVRYSLFFPRLAPKSRFFFFGFLQCVQYIYIYIYISIRFSFCVNKTVALGIPRWKAQVSIRFARPLSANMEAGKQQKERKKKEKKLEMTTKGRGKRSPSSRHPMLNKPVVTLGARRCSISRR